jgi:putative ABC transport system permease protein
MQDFCCPRNIVQLLDVAESLEYPFAMPAYLSFKELWRNRGRFLLVSLVIALITTLVLFIAALAEGLGTGNREYLSKLNAELVLYQENSNLSIGSSRIGRSKLNDIRRVEGVENAGPIGFSFVSIILNGGREPLDAALIGVEPGRPGMPPVLAGRPFNGDQSKEAVLDRNAALRAGLKVGDEITIKTTLGTKEEFYTVRVVGVSDGQQYSIQPSIFVPYFTWDRIRPKAAADADQIESASNIVAVKLKNPADIEAASVRLVAEVGGIESADLKTAYENTPGYSAQQSTLNTQNTFTLLIGLLVIGGFFQIQTLQKVAQIGMLKAIGAPNRTIALAAILQILTVTVIGVAIGTVGTLLLSLTFPVAVPIVFTQMSVVTTVIALLLIGPIGGLVSVRSALRVEPLKALGLAS